MNGVYGHKKREDRGLRAPPRASIALSLKKYHDAEHIIEKMQIGVVSKLGQPISSSILLLPPGSIVISDDKSDFKYLLPGTLGIFIGPGPHESERIQRVSPKYLKDELPPKLRRAIQILELEARNALLGNENAQMNHIQQAFPRVLLDAVEEHDKIATGHGDYVAAYTMALAKAWIEQEGEGCLGPYDLQTLCLAARLHDVGKIVVPQHILLKAARLNDEELRLVKERFKEAVKMSQVGNGAGSVEELNRDFDFICSINGMRDLSVEDMIRLEGIKQKSYLDVTGKLRYLLPLHEAQRLSTIKGNLTPEEWELVKLHPTKSSELLYQLYCGSRLAGVAELAWQHHEYQDGSGYPRGLDASRIARVSGWITISDIYDGLTIPRPYRMKDTGVIYKEGGAAYLVDAAIGILESMAEKGQIRKEDVVIFKKRKIYALPKFTEMQDGGNQ